MAIDIRPYQAEDAQALTDAAQEATATVYPWLPWCRPDYAIADARRFIADAAAGMTAATLYEFVVVDGGRIVGGVGVNAIRGDVGNLGYWVRPSARGRGVAADAVRTLLVWVGMHTKLATIEALVPVDNTASLRVAAAAGGVRVRVDPGRMLLHGVRHDAVVFHFAVRR